MVISWMGEVGLKEFQFFLIRNLPLKIHTHIFIYHRRYTNMDIEENDNNSHKIKTSWSCREKGLKNWNISIEFKAILFPRHLYPIFPKLNFQINFQRLMTQNLTIFSPKHTTRGRNNNSNYSRIALFPPNSLGKQNFWVVLGVYHEWSKNMLQHTAMNDF